MKRRYAASLLILLIFFTTGFSQNSELNGWQKVQWGMSKEEVQKVYDLSKTYVEVDGEKFGVGFHFDKENKIEDVALLFIDGKNDREALYESIDVLLRQKYGVPTKVEATRTKRGNQSLDKTGKRVWVLPKTTIELEFQFSSVGNLNNSFLRIKYLPTQKGLDSL
jgi:hypothetical protein